MMFPHPPSLILCSDEEMRPECCIVLALFAQHMVIAQHMMLQISWLLQTQDFRSSSHSTPRYELREQ